CPTLSCITSCRDTYFLRFSPLLCRLLAQPFAQLSNLDHLASRLHAGAAEYTFQLPDIAPPRIAGKDGLRPWRYAADRFAILLSKLFDKKALQQGQVFSTIRQPRQLDLDHG